MPIESDSGDKVFFLTPEGDKVPERSDQGVSPKLRRSSRKRKSVVTDMPKGLSSKKKKNSPGKSLEMTKTPRTPVADPPQKENQPGKSSGPTGQVASSLEELLTRTCPQRICQCGSQHGKMDASALDRACRTPVWRP